MSYTQSELGDLAKRYTEGWNSKVPEKVAAFHAPSSSIVINRGEASVGHEGLTAMAAGFYADVPDLCLTCDDIRGAGSHVIYVWTFTGHHAETGNPLKIRGWEEWELNDEMKVISALGWFDGDEYDRQVAG
jgi:hypothetical protein